METLLNQMHRYSNYEPLIFRTSLRPSISHMQSYFTSCRMIVWVCMCWPREGILWCRQPGAERWSFLSSRRINTFKFQITSVSVHRLLKSWKNTWQSWEEVFKYSAVYCLVLIDSQCLLKGILLNSFSAMLKDDLLFDTIGNNNLKTSWTLAVKFAFPTIWGTSIDMCLYSGSTILLFYFSLSLSLLFK